MAGETIILDPTAVATGRTQLDITSYVAAAGPNWGDGEITAYMADQQVGSTAVDYRLPNRQISIPLSLRALGATTFATIRSSLQQKAALFQRRRGWIMRQVGATPLYADIVNATLHLGGAWLAAYRDVDIDAVLTLECIPDFYGDEITLSDHVETTLPHLLFTEATVNGNHPGRVRIVVDNDQSGQDQHGLIWGFRANNYNAGTTAALFYECEKLTPLNNTSGTALSGASGGTAVGRLALASGYWTPLLHTNMLPGSVALTHQGSYRAWVRAYAASGFPQLRLVWGNSGLSTPIVNDPVQIPTTASFYLLDLGAVQIDPVSAGASNWAGVIQGKPSTVAGGDTPYLDCLWLQPLDETAGKLTYLKKTSPTLVAAGPNYPTSAADNSAAGTVAWDTPANAQAADGTVVAALITAGGSPVFTHYLTVSGLGFALPSVATVLGIQVEMLRRNGGATIGATAECIDSSVYLIKAGTIQTTTGRQDTTTNWPPLMTLKTYGSSTDLWGNTWGPTDVNNSGFGVAMTVGTFAGASGQARPQVDYIRVTVYWQNGTGFAVSQDSVAYATQSVQLGTDGIYREDPTGTVWAPVAGVTGDLPRIPPSGLEGGTIQTFVKMTRGNFADEPDAGIDDLSARIFYRPSYLITP